MISGTGGLILVVVVILIIVSTLLTTSLLGTRNLTTTVTDERDGYINATAYQLGDSNSSRSNYVILAAANGTSGNAIVSANWTLTGATGILVNATAETWLNVTFNYTYDRSIGSEYSDVSDDMGRNLTEGIDNVSEKIPTILLIGAVVLLFGVIVLLIRQTQAMGWGGNTGSL